MPTKYGRGLGGSPYTYNIIRPSGVNEVGSQYTDLDRDYFGEFMDAYREGKDRHKQERRDRQAEALKVSEMLGYVPEELEADVLGPVQEVPPTLGERAVGGLGRMLGIDTEIGTQPEQFEVPEGQKLSTQYERDIEKTDRETKADYTKFLRDLYKQQFGEELKLGSLRSKVGEGLIDEPDTQARKIERIRETAKARQKWGTGKTLTAREKLQNDLYSGTKNMTNLTPEDYLILGKYWSASTPASRSKEAIRIATDIFEADQKGKAKKATKDERNAFIDEVSREIIQKQEDLMGQIRESEIDAYRGRGLYGVTGQGQPTLDDIWTGGIQ
jgi:hypothetical protein